MNVSQISHRMPHQANRLPSLSTRQQNVFQTSGLIIIRFARRNNQKLQTDESLSNPAGKRCQDSFGGSTVSAWTCNCREMGHICSLIIPLQFSSLSSTRDGEISPISRDSSRGTFPTHNDRSRKPLRRAFPAREKQGKISKWTLKLFYNLHSFRCNDINRKTSKIRPPPRCLWPNKEFANISSITLINEIVQHKRRRKSITMAKRHIL
jgi:hypothetical protein